MLELQEGRDPVLIALERTAAPEVDAGLPGVAGSLFGDYRLGRELGRGGMGVVYRAEDTLRIVGTKPLSTRGAHTLGGPSWVRSTAGMGKGIGFVDRARRYDLRPRSRRGSEHAVVTVM